MQMQTPKTSPKSSAEGSRKISPRSSSSETTQRSSGRTARQLKTTGLEANPSSPNKPTIRTPKSISPVISARKSPKSPISEKKGVGRVAELETQISQLQDALKTVKEQLVSSESWKDQAQQEAEDSRKQLLALSSKLEESQKLLAMSSSQELNDIEEVCESGDEAWKSKFEAAKNLHSADLDAVASAINEIDELQVKLDVKAESEATKTKQAESTNAEVHSLKEAMAKTLSLVAAMKNQLKECRRSESQAQDQARGTLLELETAKKTIESLKLDSKAMEDEDGSNMKLDLSREHESDNRDKEIKSLRSEVGKLKSDAETAETRFNEEQTRRRLEITSAYELVEDIKFKSRVKESELEGELKKSKADIEELKANLMDKETELQGICEENEDLNSKLKDSLSGKRENDLETEIKSLKEDCEFLKSKLKVPETELDDKLEENEKLKLEMKKMDCKEPLASKSESITKVDHLVDEIEKSKKEVAGVAERLGATEAANCELEAELRKLKAQADQWRKAAEAAAAMLSTGNNTDRKLMERTGSMDNCNPGRTIGSPYGEGIDEEEEELLKKKNGNMLKRIGVLWKKPQNKRP